MKLGTDKKYSVYLAVVKRVIVLLIIIPIVIVGSAMHYIKKEKSNITSTTLIALGNVEQYGVSNTDFLIDKLKSIEFTKALIENNYTSSIGEYTSKLTITPSGDRTSLFISYSGDNKETNHKILNSINRYILDLNEKVYSEKINLIESNIKEIQQIQNNPEPATSVQVIYNLLKDKNNLIKASILNEPTSTIPVKSNNEMSIVLGLLTGILIDIALVLFMVKFWNKDSFTRQN